MLPVTLTVIWSVFPVLKIINTCWQAPELPIENISTSEGRHEIKRQVQRHFMASKVYIPREDILIPTEIIRNNPQTGLPLLKLLRESCKNGKIYVFLPIKFNLPFLGAQITEWCWIPQVSVHKPA